MDLEKGEGEMPMTELMRIPGPSHLDDWDLYKRFEINRVDEATESLTERAVEGDGKSVRRRGE